jgi:2-isopropylmalate synthase
VARAGAATLRRSHLKRRFPVSGGTLTVSAPPPFTGLGPATSRAVGRLSAVGIPDPVRDSARDGRLVLWEESARDGAQGKTLMSAEFRVRLAREQGAVFGAAGPRHVVFAAGFPAVCPEEFAATRRVALEANGFVSPAAVCRGTLDDVRQACAAVRGAAGARVMIVVPASTEMAGVMVHRPAAQALADAVALVRAVRDEGSGVVPDVCFADAPRADIGLMADAAGALTAAGAGVIVVADTTGDLLTERCAELFTGLLGRVADDVVLASHLHNDLGLGLANTLAVVRAGVRVVSSSWLGVAERSGMVATEQLLFLLAHRAAELLGPAADLWPTRPDLTRIPAIAQLVSAETGIPLTVTTPIVGTGVGTISTGTPFVHPATFQPYDPALLGIEPTVVLTHLASARVLRAVAERTGLVLDRAETTAALAWVKSEAFRRNEAVIPDADLAGFVTAHRAQHAVPPLVAP